MSHFPQLFISLSGLDIICTKNKLFPSTYIHIYLYALALSMCCYIYSGGFFESHSLYYKISEFMCVEYLCKKVCVCVCVFCKNKFIYIL